MKIVLILLVAFASSLVISTTYAEKKGSEENSLNFSLEKDHREKEQNRFLHKSVDMGRKVEGGIKVTPYAIGFKSLVEKNDNIQVAKKTDDDDNGDGSPPSRGGSPPSRGSSIDTHRQINYEDFRKLFHDIPKPSP